MKGRCQRKEEESRLIKNDYDDLYCKDSKGKDEETAEFMQEPLKQWLSGIELTDDIFCCLAYQLFVFAENVENNKIKNDSDCHCCDRSSNEESFSLDNIYVIINKKNTYEKLNSNSTGDSRLLFLRLFLHKDRLLNITPNSYRLGRGRLLHDSREKRQEIIAKSEQQHSLAKSHITNTDSPISHSAIACLTQIMNLKTDTFTSLMRLQMARMFFLRTFKGTVTESLQYFVVLLWKLAIDQAQISIKELRTILTAVILNAEKNPSQEISRCIKENTRDFLPEQMNMRRSYFRQSQVKLRMISCELSSQLNAATSNYLGYVHSHKSTDNIYNNSWNYPFLEFCSAQKKSTKEGVCSIRHALDSLELDSPSHEDDDEMVADNRIADNHHLEQIIRLRKALRHEYLNIDYTKLKQKVTSSVYQCNSIRQVIQLFSTAISQSERVSIVSHVALQFFELRKYKLASYFAAQALALFYSNLSNTFNANTSTNNCNSSSSDELNHLISEVYFALGAIFHSKLEHSKALKCLTAARRFNHRNAAQVLIFYSRRAADQEAVETYLYETIRQPRKTLPFIPPSFSSKDTSEYLYQK